MRMHYDSNMKILLPIFSGVLAGVAGNLANPHISNIGLLSVMSLGVMSIYTLQKRIINI